MIDPPYRRGREAVDRLARTSYTAYKMVGQLKLRLRDLRAADPPPLLVYQMGKVGSTSVIRSLKALELPMQIHQVHSLSPAGIAKAERIYRERFSISRQIDAHLLSSFYLRRRLRSLETGETWKVVTLVRDPVARNLSSFFQVLHSQYADLYQDLRLDPSSDSLIPRLIDAFFTRFPHEEPLRWFDNELNAVLGFDTYHEEFPRHRGYAIHRTGLVDVLTLRVEDLDRCAADAFNEFLEMDGFELLRANEGEDKLYGEAYKRVSKVIEFPNEYLDQMYTSRYVTHFYSAEEIAGFRGRWARRDKFPSNYGRV